MNELCHNHKREYYKAIMKNEQILTTWMEHNRHHSSYKVKTGKTSLKGQMSK